MERIETKAAPAAIGPYSQAIVTENYIYTSGQIPLEPETGAMISGGIREQTRQVIANIDTILKSAGSGLDRVIKTTCYLKNLEDFAEFNSLYAEYFVSLPARSCVEVSNLPKGASVEIEVIAVK